MDIDISGAVVACFALYGILLAFVLSCKQPNQSPVTLCLLSVLILLSWAFALIDELGILAIILLAAASFFTAHQQPAIAKTSWVLLVFGALACAFHAVPGFNNQLLYGPRLVGQGELPFKLYANLDKAIAGVLLLAAFRPKISIDHSWNEIRQDLPRFWLGLCLVFGTGILLGINFDLKFGQLTLAFLFFNLAVTCIAEEGFFRLVIQDGLTKVIKHRMAPEIAIFLSAAVFTAAHFHTGPEAHQRLLLIFLAGLSYAWVYAHRRSLVSAVLMHFLVNIFHLSFFTYPASFS